MIVLETNVISHLMGSRPRDRFDVWVDSQPASRLFTTSVTEAEILYGVALLPDGQRRQILAARARDVLSIDFAGRVLAFDSDAARAFAVIAAGRRKAGRPVADLDAQIAAIARSRGAAVATRNTRDFADCGIEEVDPWAG